MFREENSTTSLPQNKYFTSYSVIWNEKWIPISQPVPVQVLVFRAPGVEILRGQI